MLWVSMDQVSVLFSSLLLPLAGWHGLLSGRSLIRDRGSGMAHWHNLCVASRSIAGNCIKVRPCVYAAWAM